MIREAVRGFLQDAYEGGKQAVAECWRNITATGAEPLASTDNLNFGNPERPEIMGQFVRAIEGIGEACRALEFPVVSGNVSLYNETNGEGILPTPTIGGVGLMANWKQMARLAFANDDDAIICIGNVGAHSAHSRWPSMRPSLLLYSGMPFPRLRSAMWAQPLCLRVALARSSRRWA